MAKQNEGDAPQACGRPELKACLNIRLYQKLAPSLSLISAQQLVISSEN